MASEREVPAAVRVWRGPMPLVGAPFLPGAKYAAVRAVLASALAGGRSTVAGVPRTEDTAVLLAALVRLGVALEWRDGETLAIDGCAGAWPARSADIDAGNAGAVLRLLLGVTATLDEARFTTAYADSLGERPNADLLDALRQLGVEAEAREPGGRLPITLRGAGLHGGAVSVSGARSSQYLSALLMLAPLIGVPVTIAVTDGLRSASFARLTARTLAHAGVTVTTDAAGQLWRIPGGQRYQPRDWRLARDFPTAVMWLAATAVAGARIVLDGLDTTNEDASAALVALVALGVRLTTEPSAEEADLTRIVGTGGATLRGAVIDGEPIIDSVPALAAAACFASGATTFTNVGTLRLKESNRIDDLCAEFNRAGAEAIPDRESLTIVGHPEGIAGGATVDTHADHRLAMALAILALGARAPLVVTGAHHVAKSYPAFWSELVRLGAEVAVVVA